MKTLLSVLTILFLYFAPLHLWASDITEEANDAAQKEGQVGMQSLGKAAVHMGICVSGPPQGPPNCVMAAMYAAQALMGFGASDGSRQTATDATSIGTFGSFDGGGGIEFDDFGNPVPVQAGDAEGGSGLFANEVAQARQIQRDLDEKGFGFDQSTGSVKTPDGTIPGTAFANPSTLGDFGFSSDQIDIIKEAQADASKIGGGYSVSKVAVAGGGGGGRRRRGSGSGDDDDYGGVDYKSALLARLNNKKGVPKGLSRTIAGTSERIGVAGDNIFDMIRRRYQAKKRVRYFLP